MPPIPGEDCLLTVFTDVHYYFTVPTPNPAYHRFDKGSYFYIYYDATRGSGRLEIANNPGTNDQDSFNGALDNVHIVHSTRFPTLCTLTVGSQAGNSPVSTHSSDENQDQWHLPMTNRRNHSKHNLRLHTLDIYFWTVDDADQFLDAIERILPPQQLETDRQAHSQAIPEPAVSRVVEKLENVAITDPAYQNGQTKGSNSEPKLTPEEAPNEEVPNYTPLAYNPAAPAAPEPISVREATPPPVDAEGGTGLAMAAMEDSSQQLPPTQTPGMFSQTQSYTVPGLAQYGYSSPPPSAGLSMPNNLPGPPPLYSAVPVASLPPNQAASMSFAPPPQDPNAHLFPQSSQQHESDSQQPQSHEEPEDPRVAIAGFSNYSYAQPVQQQYGQLSTEYDIHNQIYVPTEAELKGSKHAKSATKKSRGTKLEAGLNRMDSTVNNLFKRLEKTIG